MDGSLFRSAGIRLQSYRCRPVSDRCGGEERTPSYDLVWVRRGCFVKHVDGETILGNANHLLLFNPQQTYRVSHPGGQGDDGTILSVAPRLIHAALTLNAEDPTERVPWFPVHSIPCDRQTFVDHMSLLTGILTGSLTDLAIEECLHQVARRVIRRAFQANQAPQHKVTGVRQRHRNAVQIVQQRLASCFDRPGTLAELAAQTGVSVYHLCRIFRQTTGSTIHRYRNQLRLRASLLRLGEGERDLTRLALDLGFTDHSHFSNTFRAYFGASPSHFRRTLCVRKLNVLSKNLQAEIQSSTVN